MLACAVAERVGQRSAVVGLDPNAPMLAVARGKGAAVTWQAGRAEALPFPEARFDAVVSQFGLMFFDDQPGSPSGCGTRRPRRQHAGSSSG